MRLAKVLDVEATSMNRDTPATHQEEPVDLPADLRYTKEHEWARAEGSRVRVGITDFAQDALGDVVYVDIPEVGAEVSAGQPFGEVESTKSVSDVYSPVSGTIVERNPLIEDRPEFVNDQPYGDGWLVVIDPTSADPLADLLDAESYRSFLEAG
jgi:glycine cleavage system H protein